MDEGDESGEEGCGPAYRYLGKSSFLFWNKTYLNQIKRKVDKGGETNTTVVWEKNEN